MAELLLTWALQPLSWALAIGCLALLLAGIAHWRRSGCAGRRSLRAALVLGATGCLGLWAMATPVLSNALARLAERPADTTQCSSGSGQDPVVVPGAGMHAWTRSHDPFRLLDRETLSRTLHALDMAGPTARIYVLGGGDNGRSLAALMSEVLRLRGVPGERIVEEPYSRSTRANAERLRPLLPQAATIRLVTSALHMPRARAAFERVGYRVCEVPSGTLLAPSAGLAGWLPWLTGLARTHDVVRELLARTLYALDSR